MKFAALAQMPQMPTISSKVLVGNTGSMTRANGGGFTPTPIPTSMAAFSNATVSSYARSVHVPTNTTLGINGGQNSRQTNIT